MFTSKLTWGLFLVAMTTLVLFGLSCAVYGSPFEFSGAGVLFVWAAFFISICTDKICDHLVALLIELGRQHGGLPAPSREEFDQARDKVKVQAVQKRKQ